MHHLLDNIESARLEIGGEIDQKQKSELGQFMTPLTIARFMAALFPISTSSTCRLLDPGAGIGSLSCAFLDRWISGDFPFQRVELNACEIDKTLYSRLLIALSDYKAHADIRLSANICDFIEKAVNDYLPQQRYFTHAILNPPYKKITSDSRHRLLLRQAGIETVNLYSAFVALSLALLVPGGQLVAIIPRSFCNGPYYRPFREFIFDKTSIRQIHLFGSRNKAFKEDGVLQENIIIALEREGHQGEVTISTSNDDTFSDYTKHEYPFYRIVNPDDPEKFIHIPTSQAKNAIEISPKISYSLFDLGVEVSTGPVVDFRVRKYIRDTPELNTVPLLYPGHFNDMSVKWPNFDIKKPNALIQHPNTEKWLYPSGFYTVIKRFSSKEEKRRITANITDPATLPSSKLGFENHLNVLHHHKQGLPELLARGLAIFLNSTVVDNYFRQFNGHTQVNATDLRLMKYPSRDTLFALGEWSKSQNELNQLKIDEKIETIL